MSLIAHVILFFLKNGTNLGRLPSLLHLLSVPLKPHLSKVIVEAFITSDRFFLIEKTKCQKAVQFFLRALAKCAQA